jgi:hypothetical protein
MSGGDPVERALERYARTELEPDQASLAQGRAAILARFDLVAGAWSSATDVHGADIPVGAGSGSRRIAGRSWPWSDARPRVRLAVALAGAALLVAVSGAAFAASGPGGPLYTTRLDIEAITLPPTGSAAWFSAEAGRLSARLSEAEGAAASDNTNAVEAAVGAYRTILSQTITGADTSTHGAVPPGLARALDRHAELLSSLLARAPKQAQAALRAALGELQGAVAASGSPSLSSRPGTGIAPGMTTPPGAGNPGTAPGPQRTPAPALHNQPPKSHGGKGAQPTPTPTPEALTWEAPRAAAAREALTTAREARAHHGRPYGRQLMLAGFEMRADQAPR